MVSNSSSSQPSAGIIIFICIVIVCGFAFFALINKEPDQREEDCSKVEIFDAQKKRCRNMTGREYAQKWAKSDEANVKSGRERATVCVPADEITSAYEGKYILACFTVEHIYDTGKGTVFLDSGSKRGDFSAVSFRYDPLKYSDAKKYLGKFIGVYGTVTNYKGQREIIINTRDQITTKPYDYYEGYSKNELANKRSSCFEKEIQSAKTKESKNKIMSKCRVLSLKGLLDDTEDYGY